MPKVTLTDIQSGSGVKDTYNANNDVIEAAFDNTLSRDGSTPNAMGADLDMNSNKVINLEDGVNNADGVNVRQLNAAIAAAGSGLVVQQIENKVGSDATANKFTLTGITYNPGANTLNVYRNGVRLQKTLDYTETSETEVTLTFTPNDDDNFVFTTNESTTSVVSDAANVTYSPAGTGAVATNVQDKLREVVHINDFVPAADGSTDDSAEFILAAALGKPVELEPGKSYAIDSTVTLSSGTQFYCNGRCTITTNLSASDNLFEGSSTTDNAFRGIFFDMPVCSSSVDITPVRMTGCTRFTMRDCSMDDGGSLVHIFGGTDIWIQNNEIDGNYWYGIILADDITNAWITDNKCKNSGGYDGIKIAGAVDGSAPVHKDIFILDNECNGNARDGIDVAVNDGSGIIIRGNRLYGNTSNGVEFKLLDTDPVKLTQCDVSSNYIEITANNAVGISLISAGAAATNLFYDVTCKNNQVICDDTSTQTGYKMTNVMRTEICENYCYQGLYQYRFLASNDCDLLNNVGHSGTNLTFFATDGTNSPTNIRVGNNVAENCASRTYYETDSGSTGIEVWGTRTDGLVDAFASTGWRFNDVPGGILTKTANFNMYAGQHGYTFTNSGTAANVTGVINNVFPGIEYTFIQTDSATYQLHVSPPAGVSIGAGGAGKDLYIDTDDGVVTIRAISATQFIVMNTTATLSYEP